MTTTISKRPASTQIRKVWSDDLATVPAAVRAVLTDGSGTLAAIEQVLTSLTDAELEAVGSWFDGATTYTWSRASGDTYRHQRGPDGSDWGNYRI